MDVMLFKWISENNYEITALFVKGGSFHDILYIVLHCHRRCHLTSFLADFEFIHLDPSIHSIVTLH